MTVRYGVGSDFLAQCPPTPPAPEGYAVWQEQVNGPVPPVLTDQAKRIAYDMTRPLGYTETANLNGFLVILRVDPHTWTNTAHGVVSGCFHGVTLYVPIPPHHVRPPSSTRTGLGVVLELLTLASLTTGLAYTVPRLVR